MDELCMNIGVVKMLMDLMVVRIVLFIVFWGSVHGIQWVF